MRKQRFHLVLGPVLLCAACMSPESAPEERTVDFYNHNAQSYYDGGQYQRALLQFGKALEVDEDDQTALLGRAWTYVMLAETAILLGQTEAAENIQLARTAFEDLADRDLDEHQFKADLGLGKVHTLLGDLYDLRARKNRAEILRRPEGSPKAAALVKAERDRDREYAAAERAYHRVLGAEDEPGAKDNLTALIQLARLAVLRQDWGGVLLYAERYREQVRRSKALWVKSMSDFPEDRPLWEAKLHRAVTKEVEVLDLIANAHYKRGELRMALSELNSLILLNPDRPDSYGNRGKVLEELGQKRKAVDDYRKFIQRARTLEMDPGDPRAIEATTHLMRLEEELGLEPTVPPAEDGKRE